MWTYLNFSIVFQNVDEERLIKSCPSLDGRRSTFAWGVMCSCIWNIQQNSGLSYLLIKTKTILKFRTQDLKWGQQLDEDNRTNFYHMFSKNSCHIQMAEQRQLIHPSVSVMLIDLMWHVSNVLAKQAKLAPPSSWATGEVTHVTCTTHACRLLVFNSINVFRLPMNSRINYAASDESIIVAFRMTVIWLNVYIRPPVQSPNSQVFSKGSHLNEGAL